MKALIFFTRTPVPGKTKTRLMPHFTADECAEIHTCFLKDLYQEMATLAEVTLFTALTNDKKDALVTALMPENTSYFYQEGTDIGERMNHAFRYVFQKGYDEVVLIGTDLPMLTKKDVYLSFSCLSKSDVVIGPTFDGGYYLIGLKDIHTPLFTDVLPWGEASVLEKTCALIRSADLTLKQINKQRDIDTFSDYCDLVKQLEHEKLKGEHVPLYTDQFIKKRKG